MVARWLVIALIVLGMLGCTGKATAPPEPVVSAPEPTAPVAPAAPSGQRYELGHWQEGLLLLEMATGQARVLTVDPAGKERQVATVPATEPMAQHWGYLNGPRLWLIVTAYGNAPGNLYRIELATGEVTDMGGVLGAPFRSEYGVSRDGRWLGWKQNWNPMAIELINLLTGERRSLAGESHLVGYQWSPVEDDLAVRAAEEGAGLPVAIGAMYMDGATHVDVIDAPTGKVRHLHPPEKLALTHGPVWSPEGTRLAVVSGIVEAARPELGSTFEPTHLWVIDVASGTWSRVGPWTEGLSGWPTTLK